MPTNQQYTLSNLMNELNLVIRSSFDQSYWVIAELANVSTSPRGHMYLELVEKSGPQIIAKARANLWSSKRNQIVTAFEDVTHQTIKTGMKLLLQMTIDFHPVYGISFQVHDIDPNYSLGELERQRQETIKRLETEGLLDFNKQYVLSSVLQNIAIISSETAAGYQDFMNQLENNKQGYSFKSKLFAAMMQGDQAMNSIIKAVDKIEESNIDFDAVIIIRGGGSNLDLACFDDYEMNARLAQSFFPILSGIGHERDQSVTDMIAHTRLKTPTAVAEFIIQHNFTFEQKVTELFGEIINYANFTLDDHKDIIKRNSRTITDKSREQILEQQNTLKDSSFFIHKSASELIHKKRLYLRNQQSELSFGFRGRKDKSNFELQNTIHQIKNSIESLNKEKTHQLQNFKTQLQRADSIIDHHTNKLKYIQNTIKLSDPEKILKKGFSISRLNGKALTHISDLKESDIIETQLYSGSIKSKIIKKKS